MARHPLQSVFLLVMACQSVCVAAAPRDGAADPPIADKPANRIRIEDQALSALVMTGAYRLRVDSRWHKGDHICDARGRVAIQPDQWRRWMPDKPVAVGASWSAPDKPAAALAQRLYRAIELHPRNQPQWQRWVGGNWRNGQREGADAEQLEPAGKLRFTLEQVKTDANHAERRLAVIHLDGQFTVRRQGRLSNRYGPNSFDVTWRMPLDGAMTIDLGTGRITALSLTSNATVKGKYFTAGQGEKYDEPFDASVKLRVDLPLPPSPKLAKQVAALVAQLADDSFTARQTAHKALAKLGPSIEPLLKQHLRNAKDAEVKWRLGKLVERSAR